jgi:dienelactone hydrolase
MMARRRRGPKKEAEVDVYSPEALFLSPDDAHTRAAMVAPRALAWARAGIAEPRAWQEAARSRLAEIAGYGRFGGPPAILRRRDLGSRDGLFHQSLYLRVRDGLDIPVRLVWEGGQSEGRAAMICLQGEGRGVHVSWGESHTPEDARAVEHGYDFARQAARRGHLAVCMELPGVGERRGSAGREASSVSEEATQTNMLMLGRTTLGEGASDVSIVLNWLILGDVGVAVDPQRLAAIGHDVGGATGLFVSALDPRLAGVLAVGCIGSMRHAVKRGAASLRFVVPGLLRWMDTEDIIALCAPRPVVAVAARHDPHWPISEAVHAITAARPVYEQLDAGAALSALPLEGDKGFDPDVAWPIFEEHVSAAQPEPERVSVYANTDSRQSQPR